MSSDSENFTPPPSMTIYYYLSSVFDPWGLVKRAADENPDLIRLLDYPRQNLVHRP